MDIEIGYSKKAEKFRKIENEVARAVIVDYENRFAMMFDKGDESPFVLGIRMDRGGTLVVYGQKRKGALVVCVMDAITPGQFLSLVNGWSELSDAVHAADKSACFGFAMMEVKDVLQAAFCVKGLRKSGPGHVIFLVTDGAKLYASQTFDGDYIPFAELGNTSDAKELRSRRIQEFLDWAIGKGGPGGWISRDEDGNDVSWLKKETEKYKADLHSMMDGEETYTSISESLARDFYSRNLEAEKLVKFQRDLDRSVIPAAIYDDLERLTNQNRSYNFVTIDIQGKGGKMIFAANHGMMKLDGIGSIPGSSTEASLATMRERWQETMNAHEYIVAHKNASSWGIDREKLQNMMIALAFRINGWTADRFMNEEEAEFLKRGSAAAKQVLVMSQSADSGWEGSFEALNEDVAKSRIAGYLKQSLRSRYAIVGGENHFDAQEELSLGEKSGIKIYANQEKLHDDEYAVVSVYTSTSTTSGLVEATSTWRGLIVRDRPRFIGIMNHRTMQRFKDERGNGRTIVAFNNAGFTVTGANDTLSTKQIREIFVMIPKFYFTDKMIRGINE